MKNNWLYKIQQHEATPSEGAWKNIANKLDDADYEQAAFIARIAAFETAPPSVAQKNIFALLDEEEHKHPFEKRLYNYETTAPEEAWPLIVNELNKRATKIIPLETRTGKLRPVYLRIAAAVALIAVVSITAWFLNKQRSGTEEFAAAKNQQPSTVTYGNTQTEALPVTVGGKEKKSSTIKQVDASPGNTVVATAPSYLQNHESIALAENPALSKIEKLQNDLGETPHDISLINAPSNSYITITGPDGLPLRVSSKFSNLISYLTENNPELQENIDIIIKESAKWRNTFAGWREKMTNNSIAPSLTNFMDIIELSNVLEEKK